jgi:hypothetical protein
VRTPPADVRTAASSTFDRRSCLPAEIAATAMSSCDAVVGSHVCAAANPSASHAKGRPSGADVLPTLREILSNRDD